MRVRRRPSASPSGHIFRDDPDFPLNEKGSVLEQRGRLAVVAYDATCINSWVRSPVEPVAMWTIFGGGSEGVAVRTTAGRLRRAITDVRSFTIATVGYVDYAVTPINELNMLAPYFHKRLSFEHEHEVRAVVSDRSMC
jgi:hypothetical protein